MGRIRALPLPARVRDIDVLSRTVAQGPASITWEQHGFAVADAYDERNNRYIGLVTGGAAGHVSGTSLVVRPDLAAAQVARDAVIAASATPGSVGPGHGPCLQPFGTGGSAESSLPDDRQRRFYAIAHLDPERYQRDFSKITQEVVTNLAAHLGTELEISVEIRATNSEGFPDDVIRTVTENASTLKMDQYGFERD